jgi:hypothetical protein
MSLSRYFGSMHKAKTSSVKVKNLSLVASQTIRQQELTIELLTLRNQNKVWSKRTVQADFFSNYWEKKIEGTPKDNSNSTRTKMARVSRCEHVKNLDETMVPKPPLR